MVHTGIFHFKTGLFQNVVRGKDRSQVKGEKTADSSTFKKLFAGVQSGLKEPERTSTPQETRPKVTLEKGG